MKRLKLSTSPGSWKYCGAGVASRGLQDNPGAHQEVASSDLPDREVFQEASLSNWDAALRQLAQILPDDRASIVVLDEVPYLIARDPDFEGTLQRVWDRVLSRKPVLLLLVGSDLSMMELLNSYGRPFHQRGKPMVLEPLNPSEVSSMLQISPAAAFDAFLVTGGLPLILQDWPRGASLNRFLRESLTSPNSALLITAQQSLAAEFPAEAQPRSVLTAIASGERSYSAIQRAAGDLPGASLKRALDLLVAKRMVAAERPLSIRQSRETRYRVADSYLRFWLVPTV
jgi:AAA+ ATPase superfamily predicted ATPase